MKAIWNGVVLAESDDTVVVDNNHYFPLQSMNKEYFTPTSHTSRCHWKGTANYYSIEVGDKLNENAAWYYTEPLEGAAKIRGHMAFWKGVEVSK